MFIIVLGRYVSILIESSSGPSKKTDPYLKCFEMRCGIPIAYILDKTMYKIHVSFCSYCKIGISNPKTLTDTYERGYTYVLLLITAPNDITSHTQISITWGSKQINQINIRSKTSTTGIK